MLIPLLLNNLLTGSAFAVVSGTTTFTEAQVVTGGEQTIITLTDDTWIAAGTGPIGTTAESLSIIAGITSAQSETFGWNNEVRDKEVVGALVRTSATVATITWTAAPAYDVTSNETITVTIPAAVLTAAAQLVATPTFGVTADAVASVVAAGGLKSRRRPVKLPDGRLTLADSDEIKRLLSFYKVTQEELEIQEKPTRRQMRRIKNKAIAAPEIIEELEEEADLVFVLNQIAEYFH